MYSVFAKVSLAGILLSLALHVGAKIEYFSGGSITLIACFILNFVCFFPAVIFTVSQTFELRKLSKRFLYFLKTPAYYPILILLIYGGTMGGDGVTHEWADELSVEKAAVFYRIFIFFFSASFLINTVALKHNKSEPAATGQRR